MAKEKTLEGVAWSPGELPFLSKRNVSCTKLAAARDYPSATFDLVHLSLRERTSALYRKLLGNSLQHHVKWYALAKLGYIPSVAVVCLTKRVL